MKRLSLLFLFCLAFSVLSEGAIKSAFRFEVKDVHLERHDVDSILCRITLDVVDDAVASRSAVVLQPYLLIDGFKRSFSPVSFYRLDSRGRRTQVRSNGIPASGSFDEIEKVCGVSRGILELTGVVDGFSAAGDSLDVFVDVYEVRSTDRVNLVESRRVALFTLVPCPEFTPKYYLMYVTDKDKYRFDRHLAVPLRVGFEDGSNVFKADYQTNEGAVYEFDRAVSPVVSSPHTRVQEITFTAFSGIEGSVAANRTKMQARMNSVYSYLKKKGTFGRKAVALSVVGEDWNTLQSWFSTTSWHYDRSLNDIIFGPASKDSKERNLRDCVTFWKYMEENLFPDLERFECLVRFSMLDYSDDNERWAAYNSDKRLLSQYDYCSLMRSYPEWSQSWYELALDFAEVYPLCREAQVDALAIVLSMGRLNQASDYLKYLSGQEAVFYSTVWLMLQGRIDEAYETVLSLDVEQDAAFRDLYSQVSSIYRWSVSPTPWVGEVF